MKKNSIIVSLVFYSILISILFISFNSYQKPVSLLSQCYTNLSPSKYFPDSPSPYQITESSLKVFIPDEFYIAKGSGSGSMRPLSNGAYYISIKIKSFDEIKAGDVINFKRPDGKNITHRIIDITDGGIITKGDNNPIQDDYLVKLEDISGKVVGVLW